MRSLKGWCLKLCVIPTIILAAEVLPGGKPADNLTKDCFPDPDSGGGRAGWTTCIECYKSNNAKAFEKHYLGNKRVGHWTGWHENGAVRMEADFKDGIQAGSEVVYYPNGRKRMERWFTAGKEDFGKRRMWLEDGKELVLEWTDLEKDARTFVSFNDACAFKPVSKGLVVDVRGCADMQESCMIYITRPSAAVVDVPGIGRVGTASGAPGGYLRVDRKNKKVVEFKDR